MDRLITAIYRAIFGSDPAEERAGWKLSEMALAIADFMTAKAEDLRRVGQ